MSPAPSILPLIQQQGDPYAFYAGMRRDHPVAYDAMLGMWSVFRYEAVREVLANHALFSSDPKKAGRPLFGGLPQRPNLLNTDPPRHRQLRELITRAFTPRAVGGLEPRVGQLAGELLDRVAPRGRTDLVADFAYPLPVTVIAELLGVPAVDRARFAEWADRILTATQNPGPGAATGQGLPPWMEEMNRYFAAVAAERLAAPRDDLISGLVAAEIEGERLTDEESLAFCSLLLAAGHVTTTHLIGNAVDCLMQHPEALARLPAAPALWPAAIEEVLRYQSPVQVVRRWATQEVELAGETIRAGDLILVWIGSANRDEARFPEADRFDIKRDPNPHIAFGQGVHFCLGASLARMEARIAIPALIDRLPDLRPEEATPPEPAKGFFLRGFSRLPLRFTPAGDGNGEGGIRDRGEP